MTTPETAPVEVTQADRERALKWISHNLRLAEQLMKTSADSGNGYANFAAHDAHQALSFAKDAITPRQDGLREALIVARKHIFDNAPCDGTLEVIDVALANEAPCRGRLGDSGMTCALPKGHDGTCAAKRHDPNELGYCGAPPNDTGALREAGKCRLCSGRGGVTEEQGDGAYVAMECPLCEGHGFSEEIVDELWTVIMDAHGPDSNAWDYAKATLLWLARRTAALSPDDGEGM